MPGNASWIRVSRFSACLILALLLQVFPATAQANDPPVLADFVIVEIGYGLWVAYGYVVDEDPDTCRVDLGGVLEGYSCDVSSSGDFSLLMDLPPGMAGVIPAIASDSDYEWSNTAYDYLANY
jgi:hypothetical protein